MMTVSSEGQDAPLELESIRSRFPNIETLKKAPASDEVTLTAFMEALEKTERTRRLEYTGPMNDITRDEINARLEAIEARMETRVQNIEQAVMGFKGEAQSLRSELSHAKWWAIGTAVGVLTVLVGTMQWGLSSQRAENAQFAGYLREDVRNIAASVEKQSDMARQSVADMQKALYDLQLKVEKVNWSLSTDGRGAMPASKKAE